MDDKNYPVSQEMDTSGGAPEGDRATRENSDLGLIQDHLQHLNNELKQPTWNVPFAPLQKVIEHGTRTSTFYYPVLDSIQKLTQSNAVSEWKQNVQDMIMENLQRAVVMSVKILQSNVPEQQHTWNLQLLSHVFDSKNRFYMFNVAQPCADGDFARSISDAKPNGWFVALINTFGQQKGFVALKERLRIVQETRQPVSVTMTYALLYKNCIPFLRDGVVSNFAAEAVLIAFDQLNTLSGDDLKLAATFFVQNESSLRELMSAVNDVHVRNPNLFDPIEFSRDMVLNVVLKLLKGDSFNGVMFALNEIRRIIAIINKHDRRTEDDAKLSTRHEDVSEEEIKLVSWLQKNNVLSLVFRDNLHKVQYVDKLEPFLKFYIQKRILTLEHLSLIWNAQDGKHEAIVSNIHDLLTRLAYLFDVEQLDHLLTRFKATWGGTYQNMEKLLELMGRLAQDSEVTVANKVLNLLWDLSQARGTPEKLAEAALHSHINILDNGCNFNSKDRQCLAYIQKCVDNIKNNIFEVRSIRHMLKLIRIGDRIEQSTGHSDPHSYVHKIVNKYDLTNLIINNMAAYIQHAKKAFKTLGKDTEFEKICVKDSVSHGDSVKERLDCLKQILKSANVFLEGNCAVRIWKILLDDSSCPWDKETCYSHFYDMSRGGDLSAPDKRLVFKNKVLSIDPATCSANAFQCFQHYFESIKDKDAQEMPQNEPNGIGLDFLWRCALDCEDTNIASQAIKLLRRVYMKNEYENVEKIRQLFVDKCLVRLTTARSELETTNNSTIAKYNCRKVERILILLNAAVNECRNSFRNQLSNLLMEARFVDLIYVSKLVPGSVVLIV
eukprot:m.118802 g.118802  ORF g.118802 m.118802 type:complete len:833 (+) comp14292_c1_seq2:258-2756(+)